MAQLVTPGTAQATSARPHSLLSQPLNDTLMWFTLAIGSGLQQALTVALVILIWDEWPWPKFLLLAIAIGLCGAFTTGLYVTLVLISAKSPEDIYEPAGRTDVGPLVEMPTIKIQRDDFTGTSPAAA